MKTTKNMIGITTMTMVLMMTAFRSFGLAYDTATLNETEKLQNYRWNINDMDLPPGSWSSSDVSFLC